MRMNRLLRTSSLMALLALLMLSLPVAAQRLEKEVSIKSSGESLVKLFKRVETATSYRILYVSEDVKGIKVNATFSSDDITDLMTRLLKDTHLYFTVDGHFITVTKNKPATGAKRENYDDDEEAYIITGKVVDEVGVALPGVSVFILGTKMGTTTDTDGRYSLKVRADDVLRFTFIGYKENVQSVKGHKGAPGFFRGSPHSPA